jgi:hypothetical protein
LLNAARYSSTVLVLALILDLGLIAFDNGQEYSGGLFELSAPRG